MEQKVDTAVKEIKSGNKAVGRQLLSEILKTDPKNERAWLWMSNTVDDPEDRIRCLKQALKINPGNVTAQKFLKEAQGQTEKSLISPEFTGDNPNGHYSPITLDEQLEEAPVLPPEKPKKNTRPNPRFTSLKKTFQRIRRPALLPEAVPEQTKFWRYVSLIRNWGEAIFLLTFGLTLLYASVTGLINEFTLRSNGFVTDGFVVSTDSQPSMTLWSYYATYNYETKDGFRINTTTQISRSLWRALDPGSPIKVLYLPDDQETSRPFLAGKSWSPVFSLIGRLILALILTGIGVIIIIPYLQQVDLTKGFTLGLGRVKIQVDER